jgi:uncharacterized protein YdeI (YjbR/CyaY-like superfamily)
MNGFKIATGVVYDVPDDLKTTLSEVENVLECWNKLTPLAHNEWICWIISVKKAKPVNNILSDYVVIFSKENGDLAAGRVAPIDKW